MKKVVKISESELTRIIKRVITEEKKESLMQKLMRKLKGVSDEQLKYNMENDLPWDWTGTKEGFYQKMERSNRNSGSN